VWLLLHWVFERPWRLLDRGARGCRALPVRGTGTALLAAVLLGLANAVLKPILGIADAGRLTDS